jgi:hypothetical protein
MTYDTAYLEGPGGCLTGSTIWNMYSAHVRVDTDGPGGADMNSYEIGHINYGYGGCHSGETNSSDPPDSYGDTGFRYHTVTGSNC